MSTQPNGSKADGRIRQEVMLPKSCATFGKRGRASDPTAEEGSRVPFLDRGIPRPILICNAEEE